MRIASAVGLGVGNGASFATMWETCGEIEDRRCKRCYSTEAEINSVQTTTGAEVIEWNEEHGSAYGMPTVGWNKIHEVWLDRGGNPSEPMPPTEDYPDAGVRWIIGKAKGDLTFQWTGNDHMRSAFPRFADYFDYVMGSGDDLWSEAVAEYRRGPGDQNRIDARKAANAKKTKLDSSAHEKAVAVWLAKNLRPALRSKFRHSLAASLAVVVIVKRRLDAHPWKPETWYGPDSPIRIYIDHEEIDSASLGLAPEDKRHGGN